jgi:hypothetical protein
MPAAVAIPALIGGGASLGSALISRSAAKGAAKDQQRAAEQSAAVMRQIYGDQTALMGPYVQAGHSAVGTLGRLLTPGAGAQYASAAPQPFTLPSQQAGPTVAGKRFGPQEMGILGPAAASMGANPSIAATRGANPSMPGNMAANPSMPATTGANPGPGMAYQGNAPMVQLRAPDGTVQAVPAHLAEQFIARGAQRVDGGPTLGLALGGRLQ